MLRSFLASLVLLCAAAWCAGAASADVGGQVPSPSSCSYPAVGAFGLDGVADHYVCDYPTEINGSHHHCVFGGTAALVAVNVSLLIFGASLATNAGVLEGVCYWSCPDGNVAAEPNPVMTWQGSASATAPVKRTRCESIAANPVPPPGGQPQPAGAPTPGEQSGPDSPVQVTP